jgi:hypothetical protein
VRAVDLPMGMVQFKDLDRGSEQTIQQVRQSNATDALAQIPESPAHEFVHFPQVLESRVELCNASRYSKPPRTSSMPETNVPIVWVICVYRNIPRQILDRRFAIDV